MNIRRESNQKFNFMEKECLVCLRNLQIYFDHINDELLNFFFNFHEFPTFFSIPVESDYDGDSCDGNCTALKVFETKKLC